MNRKPLPKKQGRVRLRTAAFHGIDRRAGASFGSFADALGALCTDGVTVRGAPTWEKVYTFPDTLFPQSLTAVGGAVFAMCRVIGLFGDTYVQDGNMRLLVYKEDGETFTSLSVSDRIPGEETVLASDINRPRSMVQFNVYSEDGQLSDALGGKYDKKLLIFPDKMSVDLPVKEDDFDLFHMEDTRGDVPDLYHVTVQGGRLFGVDEGRIYASAYNDPWDWDVDTPDDIGAENAWVTTTGADTRGDGAFKGICAYDGRVWGLKEDFGHIVSGESNPFTVKDSDALGALDSRSVCRGDGRLYFVRRDGVRMVEGNTVSIISDPLCLPEFRCGFCAYYGDILYVAEGDTLYAYHPKSDSWSALSLPGEGELVSLVAGEKGLYAMMQAQMWQTCIYRLSGVVEGWQVELASADLAIDTDKGPATLTVHADAPADTTIRVSLREESTGKVLDLGGKEGSGGRTRFRVHVRGGAGQAYRVVINVTGDAVIRGVSFTVRDGVKDDG